MSTPFLIAPTQPARIENLFMPECVSHVKKRKYLKQSKSLNGMLFARYLVPAKFSLNLN